VTELPLATADEPGPGAPPTVASTAADEVALVDALRAGDRAAFEVLLDRYGAAMLRVARSYVSTAEAAEDVVQETWLGVVRGIDRFEGRSSLKTWIFRILANRARTRGSRDARSVPFSSLAEEDRPGPSVEPARFLADGRWAGHWAVPPMPLPEERMLTRELRESLNVLIDELPPRQRAVLVLRDVEGLSATEACDVLGLSDANHRVLLHRARCRLRARLEVVSAEGGSRP
ncbi:MAG TPA: sigma-70 family RNA polymerase sigma factor, partial [Acidimicrobiales bacterium]|nr:sigma-70 family RNA polymerase sigma factor [Acidimicrobiales bacterium]